MTTVALEATTSLRPHKLSIPNYSGYGCSVYVMMFMDLLSLNTDQLHFDAKYVAHARDKLLLSLLQGSIARFPDALVRGT